MNLIVDRSVEEGGAIYIGNLEAASNVEYLKRHNIGAVLTVAGGTGLRYLSRDIQMHDTINADDALYQDLSQYFPRMINFIETSRQHTNVLVHCYAGISRSVTAVIAYLMQKRRWTFERTLSLVRSQRSIANPNPSFVRQLKKFETSIQTAQVNAHYSVRQASLGQHQQQPPISAAQAMGYALSPKQKNTSAAKNAIDEMFNEPSSVKRSLSSFPPRPLTSSSVFGSSSSASAAAGPSQRSMYASQVQSQLSFSTTASSSSGFNSQVYGGGSGGSSSKMSIGHPLPGMQQIHASAQENPFGYAKIPHGTQQPLFKSANSNGLYVSRMTAPTNNRYAAYSKVFG